jgi:hypothetical protein
VEISEIYRITIFQYDGDCTYTPEEVATFKGGRTSAIDDARSERPSTWVEVKEQIDQRIRDNQIISMNET